MIKNNKTHFLFKYAKITRANSSAFLRILGALFLVLIFSFLSIGFNTKNVYADAQTSAKSMVVIDANTNRVLYSKNSSQKLPMASTTKIVTALTVLNRCKNLDEEVLIDDRAVGIGGTSIYLKHGETMTVRELLFGMMLPSGNDAATALAYFIGGNIPNFCEMMNLEAVKVGAYSSSFKNPHGLDEDGHYTTALDLAKITAKALENVTFKEIVTTKQTRIKGSSIGSYRYLKNKNRLLNTLDGCIGVKTGYTGKAGRCLVSACERENFKTVCVVLNCSPMFEESFDLLNLAYSEYKMCEILPEYFIVRSLPVENGKKNEVKVCSKKGFYYPIKNNEESLITFNYVLPNVLYAPINEDQIVGEVEVYLDNCLIFKEKIYTISNVKRIGVISSIKDILSNW